MSRTPYKYVYDNWVAGFGEVLKHVVFKTVVDELQCEKEELLIVDCFAGEGVADLNQHDCPKSYQTGILKILQAAETNTENVPPAVASFIQKVYEITGCSDSASLDVYPGSPILAQSLLREADEHRLIDVRVDQVQWLDANRSEFRQIDAYDPNNLEFLLPYTDGGKHPVFLLDPNYESGDHAKIKSLLQTILEQHPRATIVVSYPMLQNDPFRWSFASGIKDVAKKYAKTGRFMCSINVNKDDFQGSGVLVCNPTKELDEVLNEETFHWLAHAMNQGKDEYSLEQIMKKKKSAA